MTSSAYRKTLIGLALVGIVMMITFPDVVFGLLFEFLHLLFELLLELIHIMFESLETVLDHLIEHLFHTDLHETQVIVFYLIVAMVGYGGYRLCRLLIPIARRCKESLADTWTELKTDADSYWRTQSVTHKFKLVAISLGIAYVIFLLSF